jgi:hypothetical protein
VTSFCQAEIIKAYIILWVSPKRESQMTAAVSEHAFEKKITILLKNQQRLSTLTNSYLMKITPCLKITTLLRK